MPLKNFQKIVQESSQDIDIYVEDAMHILERLHELLEEKFEGKQKLLADKLGKSEAEVSKMLNGVQNYTLKTLSKFSAAFGERIIAVTTKCNEADFVQAKVAPRQGYARMSIKGNGEISEEKFSPVNVNVIAHEVKNHMSI